MTDCPHVPPHTSRTNEPTRRVLLSEGSSTSARQALTALGLRGYEVEVCDPDPRCISRFSRFTRRFHRCPGLGVDPQAYLAFMLDLVSRERFDVLLPIHEQGYLFAAAQERLRPHVALALPAFAAYAQAHSKAGFSRLLAELDLPQPGTRFVTSAAELRAAAALPVVLKTPIGTASRGTWMVGDAPTLDHAVDELEAMDAFEDEVLIQEMVEGPLEHAQAVFAKGRLIAAHVYAQVAGGAGGGPAIKESVRRPIVRAHLERIGARLAWHGALSVDMIVRDGTPHYIDCNPRLVEPMSAALAGLDLADLLVRVSLGETSAAVESREGVRTHIALQALLGCAARTGSRRAILRECEALLRGRGPYAGSREELTPLGLDPPSVVPTLFAALWLLATPEAAHTMPQRGWGAHLLTPASARVIRERIAG